MFNYDRLYNTPKNPFRIDGTEINATVLSTYTSTSAPEGKAQIQGYDIADGNATFYYARVRPARDFYPKVTATQQITPVLIDVYCDISTSLDYNMCDGFGIDTSSAQFAGNNLQWWLALQHDKAQHDGNITLTVAGTGGLNKTNVNIIPANDAEDNTIAVTPGTNARPVTVSIDLDTTTNTKTNKWLIYNEGSPILPPSPLYQVEFIGNSNWTGHGDTGNVVDSDANKNKNKRLGW